MYILEAENSTMDIFLTDLISLRICEGNQLYYCTGSCGSCDEEGNVTVTEIPLIHLLPAELAPAGWNLSSDRMETQLWLSFTALRFFSIVMNHLAYE